MRFEFLGALGLMVGVFALLRGERQVIFWFIILTLFLTANAVKLTALSGASITIPYVLLAFYALRPALFRRDYAQRVVQSLRLPSPGFWLLMLTLLALLSVYFGPLLFAGKVEVYTANRVVRVVDDPCLNCDLDAQPLRFGSAYITQVIYAIGGLVAYVTTRVYLRSDQQYGHFVNAIIALCWLNLFFVVLGYVTYITNTGYLLSLVRTADYTTYEGYAEGGLMRISGTFSEASGFASFTLPLFAFCLNLWLYDIKRRTTGLLAILLFACLVLSTSSTAYVALCAYLVLDIALRLCLAPLSRATLRMIVLGAASALAALILVLVVVAFAPYFATATADFLDTIIFRKLNSESGIARMNWNRQAITVFLDTYMLGVGIGGSVASSMPLVILSNLGLAGMVLFLAVLGAALFGRPAPGTDRRVSAVIMAARAALLMKLIAMSVSQRVFGPGLPFYVFLALSVAEHAVTVARPKWVHPRRWRRALHSGTGKLPAFAVGGAAFGEPAHGFDERGGHAEQHTRPREQDEA